MSGIFSQGGAIDSVFDIFRGALGKADTSIQGWLQDKLEVETDRYTVQKILYYYQQGLKEKKYSAFWGENDPESSAIVAYIKTNISVDDGLIYNVIYGCYALAKKTQPPDTSCAEVLAGTGTNYLDDLINTGPVTALTDVVNDAAKGLGISSTVIYLILVVALILAVFLVYREVKK